MLDNRFKLHTNDPQTYFTLAVHLLSAKPVMWNLPWQGYPSNAQGDKTDADFQAETDAEVAAYGQAEKALTAIFQMNDRRRGQQGKPPLLRAMSDDACRFGAIALFRDSSIRNGELNWVIDTLDPREVYPVFDEWGLYEVVHEFEMGLDDALARATAESWITEDLETAKVGSPNRPVSDRVKVIDYFIRKFDQKGNAFVENVITMNEKLVKSRATVPGALTIPIDFRYVNGDAHPDRFRSERFGLSILEQNSQVYLDHSDFLRNVTVKFRQSLKALYEEGTRGAIPRTDPDQFDTEGEDNNPNDVAVTAFDSTAGDTGVKPIGVNPVDPIVGLLEQEFDGQTQRGSVSNLLFGLIDQRLSGFAINSLKEGAIAAVGQVQIAMDQLLSDTGAWLLTDWRDSNSRVTNHIAGFTPSTGRKEYFPPFDASGSDLPKGRLAVFASTTLAIPSDLVERINMARAANTTGGNILPREIIYDELLPDIVADTQAAIKQIAEEDLNQLPQVALTRFMAAIARRIAKEANPEIRDALSQILEALRTALAPVQNQPRGEASGRPQPQDLSPAQANQGIVGTPEGSPAGNR